MKVDSAERQTRYRFGSLWLGAAVALFGAALVAVALGSSDAGAAMLRAVLGGALGWGSWALLADSIARVGTMGKSWPWPPGLFWLGAAAWAAGLALVALSVRRARAEEKGKSGAVGAPLYPPLQRYRDFSWETLLWYGGGVLGAECLLMFLQTALAGGIRWDGGALVQWSPTTAFMVALAAGFLFAFGAGFFGAARARRLAAPEATIGLVYFGLPIPIFLSLLGQVTSLQLAFAYRLREVLYVASLLGRPEIGFWMVFTGLVLALALGITSGFVATGSGRADFKAGFELFVAQRHVSVFRPRLLLGVLAVLLLGIIPPLIVYALVRAAEAAVERTRIRQLGISDPLEATAALHEWKVREQKPTEMMTALSVGGVGVGVMALIIVLSVMSGFETDLQKKILGTNAHVIVMKYSEKFPEYESTREKILTVPGVVAASPVIWNEVMISSEGNISGTVIKGIDPSSVGSVTDLPSNILPPGSLDYLVDPKGIPSSESPPLPGEKRDEDELIEFKKSEGERVLPGILLGKELSASLKAGVGDRVNVVSPLGGELGPQGPMPKSRAFRVAGIFYTGMYEYDSKFVYISLSEAQDFFGIQGATWIELKVADIDDARRISKSVLDKLEGYPYRAKDWGEMNRNLFSALRLEKLVMGIILSIIIIVAAGLIVATVIMLVLEKRKEISVLKALGVPEAGIVKIFIAEGLQIGIAGSLLGLASGLAWCFFIEKVGLRLDPEVYYIPSLPVKIEPLQTALSVVIAVLVTFLASIYPALKASRVEPVEGLKAE